MPGVQMKVAIAALVAAGLVVSAAAGASSLTSRDGEIAFIRNGKLSLVHPNGGRVRSLAQASDVTEFEWSPDGTRLVFVRNILVGYDRDYDVRRPAIFVANADGSGERRLSPRGTHDLHPTCSRRN